MPEDVFDLVLPILGHRLALVRPTSDALEERNAVAVAARRIVGQSHRHCKAAALEIQN